MNSPFSIANNWDDFPEFQHAIEWKTGNGIGGICFVAEDGHDRYQIRLNDFPDEPAYTLILAGSEILHFDDWPSFWKRPDFPEMKW